jgi:hypothetical protein
MSFIIKTNNFFLFLLNCLTFFFFLKGHNLPNLYLLEEKLRNITVNEILPTYMEAIFQAGTK